MKKKDLRTLPLNAFIKIPDLLKMLEEHGQTMVLTSVHRVIKRVPQQSFDDDDSLIHRDDRLEGTAPRLEAINLGVGPHGLWLITRQSAEAWVAWKTAKRDRRKQDRNTVY